MQTYLFTILLVVVVGLMAASIRYEVLGKPRRSYLLAALTFLLLAVGGAVLYGFNETGWFSITIFALLGIGYLVKSARAKNILKK